MAGGDEPEADQPQPESPAFNGGPIELFADEPQPSRRERLLYCFRCHREDYHFHAFRGRWYFNLLVGLTFGLIFLVGPYRCRCCGGVRLMNRDPLSPRYWLHSRRLGAARSRRRKARR